MNKVLLSLSYKRRCVWLGLKQQQQKSRREIEDAMARFASAWMAISCRAVGSKKREILPPPSLLFSSRLVSFPLLIHCETPVSESLALLGLCNANTHTKSLLFYSQQSRHSSSSSWNIEQRRSPSASKGKTKQNEGIFSGKLRKGAQPPPYQRKTWKNKWWLISIPADINFTRHNESFFSPLNHHHHHLFVLFFFFSSSSEGIYRLLAVFCHRPLWSIITLIDLALLRHD